MQFSFTSEQEEFRSVLRRFLDEKSPPTVVRRLMETEAGWDRDSWRELNQQLGLTAVHIPEAYGGQGFGLRRARHRAGGDGPRPAVRAVLRLHRAGRDCDHERRHRGAEARRCCRPSPPATRSPRWRSPSRTVAGTPAVSKTRRATGGRTGSTA